MSQGAGKGFVHVNSFYDAGLKSYVDENKKELISKVLISADLDVAIKTLYEKTANEFYLKNKEMYQQLEGVTSAYFRLEQYVQNAQKSFFLSQIENEKTLANKKQVLSKLKLILFEKSTLPLEKLKMVHNIVYEDTNFKETLLEQANTDWWSFSNLYQVLVLLFEACAYVVSLGLYSYKSEREQCYQAFNHSFFKQGNNQFEVDDACTKTSSHLKSGI